MQNCTVIIPCFNEANRFLKSDYLEFINAFSNFKILFVNDGSTDKTLEILEEFSNSNGRISYISFEKNQGKSEAVRLGMQEAFKNKTNYYAFLDADLAIPFEEFLRLYEITTSNTDLEFTFLSKIKRVGADVNQKYKRFLIGRILATMTRFSLKLPIYDTQCGCKLMKSDIAHLVFKEKFISAWLFDIEIFWRIINLKSRKYFKEHTLEVPLNKLIERGPSSISFKAFFKLPYEFYKIHRSYK
jgi:glycosyltransferase involved in cell wall biosynthesis